MRGNNDAMPSSKTDNNQMYLHNKGLPVPAWRQKHEIKIFLVFASLGCKTIAGDLNPGIIFRLKIKEVKTCYHLRIIYEISLFLSKLRILP